MRILVALSLLLAVQTVNADDIECKISWPVHNGKIGSPVLEVEASNLDFSLNSRYQYKLDIGGAVELRNGAWKINKISRSSDVEIDFAELAREREEQLMRARVEYMPPITATKVNGVWTFSVNREEPQWAQLQ